jgi:hypothetical protein
VLAVCEILGAGVGEAPNRLYVTGFLRKKMRFDEPGTQEADITSFQTKTLKFIASSSKLSVHKFIFVTVCAVLLVSD